MIELYKRYTLTNEPGTIAVQGVIMIRNLVARQYLKAESWQKLNPDTPLNYLPALPLDWPFIWLINQGEYRGTFPKRVRSYYHKAHGLNCPDSFITEIGNLARRYSETTSAYHFEFVNRFDWQAGDFGDDSSCFWGNRAGALAMLSSNGAWAICFYDDKDYGIGRAWVYMIETNLYVVFNGYGFYSDDTFIIARIMAQFLSLNFKRINLTNNGDWTRTLYINGSGTGYLVGKPEIIEPMSSYDFRWQDIHIDTCHSCNQLVDEDEAYIGADDHIYCERCYYDLFDTCEHCGQTHWREDITFTGDERLLCQDCLQSSDYRQCAHCYEMYPLSDMTRHKERWYCEQHAP